MYRERKDHLSIQGVLSLWVSVDGLGLTFELEPLLSLRAPMPSAIEPGYGVRLAGDGVSEILAGPIVLGETSSLVPFGSSDELSEILDVPSRGPARLLPP